jgi:hypothetical protein
LGADYEASEEAAATDAWIRYSADFQQRGDATPPRIGNARSDDRRSNLDNWFALATRYSRRGSHFGEDRKQQKRTKAMSADSRRTLHADLPRLGNAGLDLAERFGGREVLYEAIEVVVTKLVEGTPIHIQYTQGMPFVVAVLLSQLSATDVEGLKGAEREGVLEKVLEVLQFICEDILPPGLFANATMRAVGLREWGLQRGVRMKIKQDVAEQIAKLEEDEERERDLENFFIKMQLLPAMLTLFTSADMSNFSTEAIDNVYVPLWNLIFEHGKPALEALLAAASVDEEWGSVATLDCIEQGNMPKPLDASIAKRLVDRARQALCGGVDFDCGARDEAVIDLRTREELRGASGVEVLLQLTV